MYNIVSSEYLKDGKRFITIWQNTITGKKVVTLQDTHSPEIIGYDLLQEGIC